MSLLSRPDLHPSRAKHCYPAFEPNWHTRLRNAGDRAGLQPDVIRPRDRFSFAPYPALIGNSTQQFTATIRDSSNQAVSWSATAGTISSSGLFTAAPGGPAATAATVPAASEADPTKSAHATVTIQPPVPVVVSVLLPQL